MLKASEFLVVILLGCVPFSALAQDSSTQFRPELDLYVGLPSSARLVFVAKTQNGRGDFAFYYELPLKPVLRRELRHRVDVLRNRYLVIRPGYQRSTSTSHSGPENRGIVEVTGRYPLPFGFVLVDRNRGEFRVIEGSPFSMRYRNRLWLERDMKIAGLVCTPYVYGELFYDTRSGSWAPFRYVLGLQIPTGPHIVLEPYALRQNGGRSNQITAMGFKFNLYF